MDNTRRRFLLAGVAVPAVVGLTAVAAPGLSQPGSPSGENGHQEHGNRRRMRPVRTTEADWSDVAAALGRPGKLLDDGRVYRVGFPRRDLTVTSYGVTVKPALSLGSYTAFARYPDGQTLLMGDFVVTESELPAVTDAAQAAGLDQTAIHKHLLAQDPPLWWTHIHMLGDAVTAAQAARTTLDHTGTPPAAPPNTTPGDLDSAALDTAIGRAGTWDGGIYRYVVPRAETITAHHRALTPGFGVTTVIGFQPTGGGHSAINGDFAMVADEVQPVIQALRRGGIQTVELHHHMLDDDPRLFYLHFWANDDANTLAGTLRQALDATNTGQ